MKKPAFLALILIFFLAAPGLFAQIPRNAKFNIQPVTGEGTREAKTFLYDRIIYEVAFNDYLISRTRGGSDYIIRGTIHSVIEDFQSADDPSSRSRTRIRTAGNRREFSSREVRDPVHFLDVSSNKSSRYYREEFVLILRLMTVNNDIISERMLVFNDLNDDASRGINIIMTDFFTGSHFIESSGIEIPEYITQRTPEPAAEAPAPQPQPPEQNQSSRRRQREQDAQGGEESRVPSEDWRDKFLFIELSFLWAPRENFLTNQNNYLNFGLNISVEVQVLNLMAVETGVQFVQETSAGAGNNRDLVIEIPLAVKLVLKPFNNFMIELYGGLSFNYFTQMKRVTPSTFSYFAGLEFCFRTKSGTFVIDPRFAMDFSPSNFGPGLDHKRRMLQLGLGYKIGFFNKLVRVRQ